MENLDKIYEVEAKISISKRKYIISEFIVRLFYLSVGIFIAILLYHKCLFNPNCNIIVTIFFAIIGLSCFSSRRCPY